jgi:hypothetical protein
MAGALNGTPLDLAPNHLSDPHLAVVGSELSPRESARKSLRYRCWLLCVQRLSYTQIYPILIHKLLRRSQDRARTCNFRFNRPALRQLSYLGKTPLR